MDFASVARPEASPERRTTLRPVQVTVSIPGELWHAVHALAPHEGAALTVILRAGAEHARTAAMRRDARVIIKARSHAIGRCSFTDHALL